MAKQQVSMWLHTGLVDRLYQQAAHDGRHKNALVEQALAEYLHVPLANRDLPEGPVELCSRCERGVINGGRCAECNWHREQRWARAPERQSDPAQNHPKAEAA